MTDKAVIQGALVNAINVAAHKSVRLYIDVPAEYGQRIVEAFGWPTMADPVPVVVARLAQTDEGLPTADDVKGILNPATAPAKPAKEDIPGSSKPDGRLRRKWDELSYAEQAGIRCSEPAFIDFCYKHVSYSLNVAEAVRHWCQVKTRADIKRGTAQGDSWEQLESKYQTWLKVAEIVG